MCDMTLSYVCHDSFICVTSLIHMCNTTETWLCPVCCLKRVCAYSTWYQGLLSVNRARLSVYRLLLSVNVALLSVYRVLLSVCRVLLSVHRARLSVYRLLLSVDVALLSMYRILLSVPRARLSVYRVLVGVHRHKGVCVLFACVILVVHMCDMTRSFVWHDNSYTYVTRLMHMCDMTHLWVWHDSSICVTHA